MSPRGAVARVCADLERDITALPRVDTPALRALRRRWRSTFAALAPRDALDVTRSLARRGWAASVVAFESLMEHDAAVELLDDAFVDDLASQANDWGSVDLLGVTLAGQAWRLGRVTDARVLAWAQSDNVWRRRLALVSTVPLNSRARGGSGDAARTTMVCALLMSDRDPMVVKAMSWALRELAKQSPGAAAAFAKGHEAKLAPLVLRELRTKIATGRKR